MELVSLWLCFGDYSDESDLVIVYDNCVFVFLFYELVIGEEYEEVFWF